MREFSEKLEKLFNDELNAKTKETQSRLDDALKDLWEKEKELNEYKKTLNEIEDLKDKNEIVEEIREMINEKNFLDFLTIFDLKSIDILHSQINVDRIPVWFQAMVHYYPEKEKILKMMNLFNIPHPTYAYSFKLPNDYDQEEVSFILDNLSRFSVPNGNHFSNNIQYFYETIKYSKGNIRELNVYTAIPWQLFLQNKLLIEDRNFEKIIENIKNKRTNSHFFFRIQEYQEIQLSKTQIKQMFEHLPKSGSISESHRSFIESNTDIIKEYPTLAAPFADKITSNSYSTFYFLNFPLSYQKDFIRGKKDFEQQARHITLMDIPKEEKINFLVEIANERM